VDADANEYGQENIPISQVVDVSDDILIDCNPPHLLRHPEESSRFLRAEVQVARLDIVAGVEGRKVVVVKVGELASAVGTEYDHTLQRQ
jgi:hypothetical protein